jgi:hypothetical protein
MLNNKHRVTGNIGERKVRINNDTDIFFSGAFVKNRG